MEFLETRKYTIPTKKTPEDTAITIISVFNRVGLEPEVGALVGDEVGTVGDVTVGDKVSSFALSVGAPDGEEVGTVDVFTVGDEVSSFALSVGAPDGEEVGLEVGISFGAFDEFKQRAHMLFR